MVLIDAAKGCASQPPNLSEFPADFVVMSFYKVAPGFFLKISELGLSLSDFNFLVFAVLMKLFGYPTGLGALLVRNGA